MSFVRKDLWKYVVLVSLVLFFFSRFYMMSFAASSPFSGGKFEVEGYGAGTDHPYLNDKVIFSTVDCSSSVYVYMRSECLTSSLTPSIYFLSDSPFTLHYSGSQSLYADSSKKEFLSGYPVEFLNSVDSELSSSSPFYLYIFSLSSCSYPYVTFDYPSSVIFFDSSKYSLPYLSPDFVLGEDLGYNPGGGDIGGGGSSSTVTYDSSIPVPQNLRFSSKNVGGFLGIGSKFEHVLSWNNSFVGEPLYTRISALASIDLTDDDQRYEDTLQLVTASETGGYLASTNNFSIGTDELASHLKAGSLAKILEYRVQFYKYVDGDLKVGPVGVIHVKTNLFGKYDGYTVTTEYPKNEGDLGESGGQDDFYDDKWTEDGEHYDEYDKDGNLVDSGTSEDSGNFFQKLINSLLNIPVVINEFFKSIQLMMSGIGGFPALLSSLFSFLPAEIISLVGLGITVVIVLRILGR